MTHSRFPYSRLLFEIHIDILRWVTRAKYNFYQLATEKRFILH